MVWFKTPTLTKQEQLAVLNHTIKVVRKRVPIVAGFGGNNTASIVKDIQDFHFDGVDAILSSSPNYNKPTQEGIFQHYMAIEAVSPRPIIIYNVPGRTGRNISAETTLRLAHASSKFIAVKEASGNLQQCMEIVKEKPTDFLLLSGDDNLTLPMIAFGGKGAISVVGNAFPHAFSEMVRAGIAGDLNKAKSLHFDLFDITNLLFVECNPSGVKAALNVLGLCEQEVRLPIVPVMASTYKAIQQQVEMIQEKHHALV